MVVRWVSHALGREVTVAQAGPPIIETTAALGVTLWVLDHAVWERPAVVAINAVGSCAPHPALVVRHCTSLHSAPALLISRHRGYTCSPMIRPRAATTSRRGSKSWGPTITTCSTDTNL